MTFKYRNMQRFVRCTIHPFIITLKEFFLSYLEDLRNDILNRLSALENKIASDISTQLVNMQNQINALREDLNNHKNNKNNPHQVRYIQTAQVSNVAPNAAQGVDGDTWSTLV